MGQFFIQIKLDIALLKVVVMHSDVASDLLRVKVNVPVWEPLATPVVAEV